MLVPKDLMILVRNTSTLSNTACLVYLLAYLVACALPSSLNSHLFLPSFPFLSFPLLSFLPYVPPFFPRLFYTAFHPPSLSYFFPSPFLPCFFPLFFHHFLFSFIPSVLPPSHPYKYPPSLLSFIPFFLPLSFPCFCRFSCFMAKTNSILMHYPNKHGMISCSWEAE